MSEMLWRRRRVLVLVLIFTLLASGFPGLTKPYIASAAGEPPILVVVPTGGSNPFSAYVTEILTAEGFDGVEVQPIGNLNSALLNGRAVVILGEVTPTAAQITDLTTFVNNGGGLIAMRPVAGLNTLLGLTTASGSTSEGYMRITDGTIGSGLYSDTMQFHGTANHYGLASGTTQVAELYSNRSTSAGRPAATIATRGTGRAAMFAYDLGRSVVMTRQGNPALANTDTDGDGVVRTIDMYRNWTDLERSTVPQADVQGRLLARLIEAVSPQPLPRLWFFPGTAPTVFIATADAHANPDSYYQTEINALSQEGTTATFYLSQAAAPSQANVAAWRSQGYDFSIHPNVTCGYACGVDSSRNFIQSTHGITPRTIRTHQVRWTGWTDAASIEADRGLQMDFNSYQWGTWLTNSSGPALGYLNGGGLPMRYMTSDGTVLSIYQQHTSLVDEFLAPQAGLMGLSLAQAVAASQATIDAAIDAYHVPIATQFHVDYFFPSNSTWATETSDYALSRGAVSMTADAWLEFVLDRAATTMSNSSWAGNVFTFNLTSGGGDQTILLPLQQRGNSLTGITRGGSGVSYSTISINGTSYAAVSASSGTYAATYAADTTAPQVTGFSPSNGATGVPVTSPVSVTFSEVMRQAATQSAFSISPNVAGSFSWNNAGTTLTFTPSATLASSTTYNLAVSTAATDLAGNPLSAQLSWSFTTAAVTPPPALTGVSPISGPITGGTVVTITGTDLTGANAVRFGTVNAASFTVVNGTTITATTPASPAGAVNVTVSTPAGTSPPVASAQFTFVDASSTMSVSSVDPGTGATAGGAVVRITGSGFSSGATVRFGSVLATNVTVVSTTQLTATVPANPAGSVNVVVTNSGGASATLVNGFQYVNCANLCLTQSSTAAFETGAAGTGTAIVETTDGEVGLAPAVGAEFSGNIVPAGWTASPWTTGGGAVVAGGRVTLDAALLVTSSFTTPGRAIEFVTTFTSGPHQHVGFGIDLNNTPWAIFSTGPSGGALFARTNGSGSANTQISGSWLGSPHLYRIEWTATNVTYFIDGVQVATHAVGIPGNMRPVASDGPLGGTSLSIDWIRMSPFAGSGSYTSRVIDSGGSATWQSISWSASVPAGTGLTVLVRAGNTPAPDGTWSAFAPVGSSGATLGLNGRFLQYRLDLSTTNPAVTPALRDVTIAYSVSGTLGPAIASVTPASGPTSGGTVVTISGSNFANGATVAFDGVAATNVTVTGTTTITATTPAHPAGTVNVTVTNPDSQSGVLAAGYTYVAGQPVISDVAPNAGPTSGGTTVTITGTNFTNATAVAFGASPASSFTVVSDTQITAVAPAQPEGVVDVRVTTAAGTSPIATVDRFTYVVLPPSPVITSVDPGTGPTTGSTVTISGANFAPGMTVRFGNTLATSLTVVSSALMTANVPAGSAGVVNVTVTNAAGTQNTLVGGYTYVACSPTCLADTTNLDFAAGSPGGSATVTDVADGEVRLSAQLSTDFFDTSLPSGWGGAPWTAQGSYVVANGVVTLDSAIVATTGFYTPGRSLEFVATFGNGPFQHAGLGIDLNGVPWIIFSTGSAGTGLYARSNSSLPSTDTLIPGSWLGTAHRYRIDWTATSATFWIDGLQVAQHTISIPGEIRPVISDGPAGGATLQVDWMRMTPYASAGTFESRVFDAGETADWTSIGWSADQPTGTSLTMFVRSGDTPAPDGTWTSYSQVTASGAALTEAGRYLQYRVDLASTNANQTPALRDVTIGYSGEVEPPDDPPAVTSLNPTSGPVAGGTAVTIDGTGFTDVTSVTFGGIAATFTTTSETRLVATTPASAAGTVDVVVTTAAGSSVVTPASRFTFTDPVVPLTITGVSPTVGSTLGGTAITVSGTGFVAGTRIILGGIEANNVVVVNGTTMTATTRPRSAGTVSAQVIKPDGTSATRASAFTYVAPPTVSSLSPTDGSTSGGRVVTITGTNFVSGATVSFDGIPATNVVFVSSTSLRATTPAHAAGQVAVTVTNPNGTSGTRNNGFTYVTPVTAAAAAPSTHDIQRGTQQSGNVSSLATNNSSYLVIRSASVGSQRIVTFYGEYTVPSARRDMVGLSIAYDGGATATGFNRTISLYNWTTSAWEVLRTETQPTSDLLTTLTVTGDPLRFMASNGRIRMRIETIRSSTSNYDLRADMMSFTVTYIP